MTIPLTCGVIKVFVEAISLHPWVLITILCSLAALNIGLEYEKSLQYYNLLWVVTQHLKPNSPSVATCCRILTFWFSPIISCTKSQCNYISYTLIFVGEEQLKPSTLKSSSLLTGVASTVSNPTKIIGIVFIPALVFVPALVLLSSPGVSCISKADDLA